MKQQRAFSLNLANDERSLEWTARNPLVHLPAPALHNAMSWCNVSQLLTLCISTHAVSVTSPVSAGTLPGPYNNLCAWTLAKNL